MDADRDVICGNIGGSCWLSVMKRLAPDRYQQSLTALQQLPAGIVRSIKASGLEEEHLYLELKHLDLQELEFQRLQALENPTEKDFSYVPAQLVWEGTNIEARIRLKGERPLHYQDTDEWSFRVLIKSDHSLKGMRRFSLHKAGARNYVYEWLFHRMLAGEDLIALQYHFVRLHLNGQDLGLYALEEHFDKQLPERHGQREGPILHFDESIDHANISLSIPKAYDDENGWIPV